MNRLIRFTIVTILLILFTQPLGLLAQEDSVEAPVIGNADNPALSIVQDYLRTHDDSLLADDVVLYDRTFQAPMTGYDPVADAEGIFYGEAFTNITVDPIQYIVTEDTIVAEYIFYGTNTGDYVGNPASGSTVGIAMIDVFNVEDDSIVSIRRYYDSADLQQQLGYSYYTPYTYPSTAVTAPIDEAILDVDDLVEAPDLYLNQTVTVEGKIGSTLGIQSFYFWDEDLIDLDQERVIVVSRNEDGFDNFYPVDDTTASVTGTVTNYTMTDVSEAVDYDLDENLFTELETAIVLVADEVTNLEPVQTIPQVEDHPAAFYDKSVTLEGSIGSQIDDHTFVFYDDQLVGIAGSIIAVDSNDVPLDFASYDDQRIRATGTVWVNDAVAIATEHNLELDSAAWSNYSDRPVFVIDEIVLLD